MSKMGQELDKRLDEAKYDMYEALKELRDWLTYNADLVGVDCEERDKLGVVNKVLASIERLRIGG